MKWRPRKRQRQSCDKCNQCGGRMGPEKTKMVCGHIVARRVCTRCGNLYEISGRKAVMPSTVRYDATFRRSV